VPVSLNTLHLRRQKRDFGRVVQIGFFWATLRRAGHVCYDKLVKRSRAAVRSRVDAGLFLGMARRAYRSSTYLTIRLDVVRSNCHDLLEHAHSGFPRSLRRTARQYLQQHRGEPNISRHEQRSAAHPADVITHGWQATSAKVDHFFPIKPTRDLVIGDARYWARGEIRGRSEIAMSFSFSRMSQSRARVLIRSPVTAR
jgi:hypothetical protein